MKKSQERSAILALLAKSGEGAGLDASLIATNLGVHRTVASRLLNELHKEGAVRKVPGKPVKFGLVQGNIAETNQESLESRIIGYDQSLKLVIEQARAAVRYPPHGLHTLITGTSGTGKTMLAHFMHEYGKQHGHLARNAPFVEFNCADYSSNPDLLLAQLFGAKKGSYTGQDRERAGFVTKADGGVLFLDEVHRLPPEGQEMLFYLIDQGKFRPLGETETEQSVKVLIICATTENIDTALLTTFTRRLPITMHMPPLAQRSYSERRELILHFVGLESQRIGKPIMLSVNTLISLLLFQDAGNVGKLKSEIQRACAISLLKSRETTRLEINSCTLTRDVRKNLLLHDKSDPALARFVGAPLIVDPQGNRVPALYEESDPDNIYSNIERKVLELQASNVQDDETSSVIHAEIDSHFLQYMATLDSDDPESLRELVGPAAYDAVMKFFIHARKKLRRVYSDRVFPALCLHVAALKNHSSSSGKRFGEGDLASVIARHREEYALALTFTLELEVLFGKAIPIEETIFIAMFLVHYDHGGGDKGFPAIVVAMHGDSTAKSMCAVAKAMVCNTNIHPYDMAVGKEPGIAYEELKNLVSAVDRGGGVLLLADMGTLKNFGEMIAEETGIRIKTLEMVSTATVLECARIALIQRNIDKIHRAVMKNQMDYMFSVVDTHARSFGTDKGYAIVSYCKTGIGTALKVKGILEEKLARMDMQYRNLRVVPLSLTSGDELLRSINLMEKDSNVIALVGSFDPGLTGIPFFLVDKLLGDKDDSLLRSLVESAIRDTIIDYDLLAKEFNTIIGKKALEYIIKNIVIFVEDTFQRHLENNVYVGFIIHFAGTLARILKPGVPPPHNPNRDKTLTEYHDEVAQLSHCINALLAPYSVKLDDDEVCMLLELLLEIDM